MYVIKRNNQKEEFDADKISKALKLAFEECKYQILDSKINELLEEIQFWDNITVEEIQDQIEEILMDYGYNDVAKNFIIYRYKHQESRHRQERLDYMKNYKNTNENAATLSNTDPNANSSIKNVASLEAEVYKAENRITQRQNMKNELSILYPKLAKQYEIDLNNHIIYTNDEASTSVPKFYCQADSLYPLLLEGVGNMDGVTPKAPDDIESFSGQLTNLAFTLSSQCKGAVAFGSYFIALNYYIIADFGKNWYDKLDLLYTSSYVKKPRTIKNKIHKAFSQFVWGINQPAGNRSYQSPFVNISYYDHTYFDSLFGEFYYPDGTQPEWKAIDTLQRLFLKWFNKLRTEAIVTFPVETMAMVYDPKTNDIIDKEYKDLTAEMYAEGHSFFTYISDSADSLASCCRLRNKLSKNTFNPTSGLTGVQTGSCNVITLNINRIIQDCDRNYGIKEHGGWQENTSFIKDYLISILERVYKYHIAYKTILYDWEDAGMFTCSNAGYIHMNKLYSTIGMNGLNEAAEFLGMTINKNEEYIKFLQLIMGTIKEQNALHSVHDDKRPVLFNSECIPAEALGGKNYRWDKEDGLLDNAHLKPFLIDSETLKIRVTRRKQGLYSCAA